MNTLQEIIHKTRYARYIPSEFRRETWPETVERWISHFSKKFNLDSETVLDLRNAILNYEVMPSMRGLMTAGPALERDEAAIFNCAFIGIDSIKSFSDLFYTLMLGTGVGFSVENAYISKLPLISRSFIKGFEEHIVEDSKEGWADSVGVLLSNLYKGRYTNMDYSLIRPAGARLKTFGGRASGPEPLKKLHENIKKIFEKNAGKKLSSIDVHDIICFIGETVVCGGVRRSATISLSDLNSEEMSLAKSGQWWVDNPQRALANNSAIYEVKPTKEIFLKEWKNLKESGSGERGIFNREGAKNNSKKYGRILKENSGLNPCVTGDTFIAVADGRGYVKMSDLVAAGEDVDVYTVKNGELVIRKMVNPRLTGKNVPIVKVNFTNGTYIKVTPNHKLILKDGRKIPAIDLNPQDEIESLTMRNNLKGFGKPCAQIVELRSSQSKIYNDFLVKTGRHPTEKEWESYKYDYKFVDSYKYAQELALDYNHRVLSIEYIQAEDVYNGTVEDTHTYFAIGNIENEKLSFTLNANCGEINLNSRQFCNLSEVVLRPQDSKKSIFEKVRLATIIGTLQSAFQDFRYIESAWELNQISERLLGVSLTGIMENRFTNGSLPETDVFLRELRDYTVDVNKEWAKKIGIEESKAITCVKPSGTVSQLTGVTSGIHPAFAKRYIRRIRIDKKDPIAKFLSDNGYPYEVDFYNKEALVFSFLQESEARTADEFSALDQLELYRLYQENWCHHNASISVYVREDEWDIVGDWVYDNFDIITGVSFFPKSEHTYVQAPYEKVSNDFKLDSPKIDWKDFLEFEDDTTASQEYACAGGACEIK